MRSLLLAASFVLLLLRGNVTAEMVYTESGGLVIMEMESTDSPLDLWQQQSGMAGFTGPGFLQFLGNTYAFGPATSPLEFTFRINQSGLYYLHLHCAKEIHDGRTDVANDAYIRVEGDYNAGPGPYTSHGDNASLSLLQSDTKYYGGAVDSWKWENGLNNLDPGGDTNKRNAVYDFKAGEIYTLVISGRSRFFRVNRIMFRHATVSTASAQNLGNAESGLVMPTADTNGEIPEGGGTAWSRGRWRQIELASSRVTPPAGRLAYVADGNSPDPDDIGANAVMLGLLGGSQLQDRLVHLSHSCDLVKASTISVADELRRQAKLHELSGEGISFFGSYDNLSDYYNCRSNQTAAVADLTAAINASTSTDPLWIIVAGEPDIIGYALQAAHAATRQYVHVVSHHPANDDSGDYFTWQQILDFGVTEHQIGDQNVGLQVRISSGLWDWAENHGNPAMGWILDQLKYAEADGVAGFQTGKYDCSDAGMVYWWLTGANHGGNSNSTPVEIKHMLLYDGATPSPALADGKFQVRSNGGLGETKTVNHLAFTRLSTTPPAGAPQVNAGPDSTVTLPENQADLVGSATDDGTIVSYLWTQLSGPTAASLTGGTNATASVGDLVEGTYTFRLSTADDESHVGSDDVSVTVDPDSSTFATVTSFTLINADTDQPVAGFDPISNGAIINKATVGTTSFNIRVNTSPAADFGSVVASLSGATTKATTENIPVWALFGDVSGDYNVAALNDGAHTLSATPYNQNSGAGEAGTPLTITFTVTNQADAPIADAGPDRVVTVPDSEVTLDGSGTDNGSIAAYTWTQDSGPNTAALRGQDSEDLTASGLIEGTYVFRLTVTDNEGNQAFDHVTVSVVTPGSGSVVLSGELKQWHKVTLIMEGPSTSETAFPNPFSDYRMNVAFTHPGSGLSYVVPGYFAADGNAANTGATRGNKWAAHLSPDHAGTWNYAVSFRTGTDVAVDGSATAGTAVTPYDNTSGSFTVSETDKTGRDHRGRGRLKYVDKHHLQYAGTGDYFMKAGVDAPENLLAYDDIDATPNDPNNQPNLRKSWSPHAGDYDAADAAAYTWSGGKGSELLGAINYLSGKGVNAFSFLTFSLDGDDDNVFPHLLRGSVADYERVADNARWADAAKGVHHDRFDVSKMSQWENIFAYADTKGMYLHFKTQETENDQRMDGGALGRERTLYYRELVARYGHHLALNWNLGEENTNTTSEERAFAQWFHDNDPYRHNVVLHTYPNAKEEKYTPLLGAASKLTGLSLQTNQQDFSLVFPDTLTWVQNSAAAGKPWVVACDEPGEAAHALRPAGDEGNSWIDGRKNALWGNMMAGGAGVEFYFGYQHANSDLTCQDFRSRDGFWNYCRFALEFFSTNHVPFHEMENQDALVSNADAWCLRKPGESYVVYLKNGGTTTLNLSGVSGTYDVRWFDPRNGGGLQIGSVTQVTGGSTVSLGNAPSTTTSDWAVLVQIPAANTPPTMQVERIDGDLSFSWAGGSFRLQIRTNLTGGTWQDYPDSSTSPVTVAAITKEAFFRLIEP